MGVRLVRRSTSHGHRTGPRRAAARSSEGLPLLLVPEGLPGSGGVRRAGGRPVTRCVGDDWSHDFPVEDSVQAYCEEHGVRLVWKDLPAEASVPDAAAEPAT